VTITGTLRNKMLQVESIRPQKAKAK
jgi:hypothetical protein